MELQLYLHLSIFWKILAPHIQLFVRLILTGCFNTHLGLRFLAEDNISSNSNFCEGVCQIKSLLLEGLFVGLVLLIILISGLCCMMGIDTPKRFEASQESLMLQKRFFWQ